MLRGLDELTLEQRERNRSAASELVKDAIYAFIPSATTIPLERRIKGVSNAGVAITFERGRYRGFDQESEEHTFFVNNHPEGTFFAPLFICEGGVGLKRIQ